MKKTPLLKATLLLCLFAVAHEAAAQEFQEVFNQGTQLYRQGEYYAAYQRFNAAAVLSRNENNTSSANQVRPWLDSCAYRIQAQQRHTDSLLQAARKLTDAFYFYDNRLALAITTIDSALLTNRGRWSLIMILNKPPPSTKPPAMPK